ncbi:flagellar hook-basal body protein [Planctomycetota bacterium]
MLTGLYSAATALTAAQHRHEVTSHNLAHASVPGFRKVTGSTVTFESHFGEAIRSPTGRGVAVPENGTDFSNGPVKSTARTLDLALVGEGFFSVTTPDGVAYTRNGAFFAQPDGTLITADGFTVRGVGGGNIQLPTGTAPSDVVIGKDGMVSVSGIPAGQIAVTDFEDRTQLERMGTTLFRASDGAVEIEPTASIQQGARELSNVSTVDELIQMIAGMRHFEAAQKVLSSIDNAISQNTDPRSS